jgi:hypothetical protein
LLGIISSAFFSCTTDDDAETEKSAIAGTEMQSIVEGPGDDPMPITPPPTKKQIIASGPGDQPIIVPPPPIKQALQEEGPGDDPINVNPPK